jgi:hypothetical protein
MALGVLVPLMPWAARNWNTLHEVQFLAPRYSQMEGEILPKGFYAWTRTWLWRFRDVYLVTWKLETEPIFIEDIPPTAFDSSGAAHPRRRFARRAQRRSGPDAGDG